MFMYFFMFMYSSEKTSKKIKFVKNPRLAEKEGVFLYHLVIGSMQVPRTRSARAEA